MSKKADYALMAVRHLALPDGPSSTSAREIAEQYDIPIELMAKVLQRLVGWFADFDARDTGRLHVEPSACGDQRGRGDPDD